MVRSTSSGQDMRVVLLRASPPPRTLVVEEMLVDWVMFCTNAPGAAVGETNSCTFEKSICWLISFFTRPCEVFAQPDTTNLRADVVVTVPLAVPSSDVVSVGVTSEAG